MAMCNIINGILNSNHTPQKKATDFWNNYQRYLDTMRKTSPDAINKGYELIDRVLSLKRLNNEMKEKIIVVGFHFQYLFLSEREVKNKEEFKEEFKEFVMSPGSADKHLEDLQRELDAINEVLDCSPVALTSLSDELSRRAILLQDICNSGKRYISRQQEVELQDFLFHYPEALPCMKEFILCRQEGAPSNVFRDACVLVLLNIMRQHYKGKVTQRRTRDLVSKIMTECFQCKIPLKTVENIDLKFKKFSPKN